MMVGGAFRNACAPISKEGRIAKATHEDAMGIVRKYCSDLERREFCGPGKEHSKECHEACGD
jgi:hypothetical protein